MRRASGFGVSVLVAGALFALGGCATIPKQAYNKSANKDVHLVCVLEPAKSPDYAVQNLGHAGMSFGLIGGLIALADISAKTNEFTKAAKALGPDLNDEFRDALIAAVEKAGYETRSLRVLRKKEDFLPAYDSLDPACDVYLDSTIMFGYMSSSGTTDYIPVDRTAVRVVKRTTKEILYQDIVIYGFEFRAAAGISIPADIKYRFKDHSALMANVPLAVEGLRLGIPLVVAQLSRDITP